MYILFDDDYRRAPGGQFGKGLIDLVDHEGGQP